MKKTLNIVKNIFVWLLVVLAVCMMLFTVVSVSTFDGMTLSVKTDISSFRTGIAVKVYYSDGEMAIKVLSSSYSSVNNLITAIKENRISPDAILVDYYGQSFIKTYPARLRELSISPKNVAYYNINSDGCLDYLILNDGTGDCHSYGVIYKHHKQTLFLSDNKTSSLTEFENVASGVAQVKYTGNTAQEIVRLAETDIGSVNNKTANLNGKSYKIWDKVQCFTLQQKNYSTSASSDKLMNEIVEQVTFDKINEILLGDEYTVKGYYDSTGTIRVLVAQKNFL